MAKAISQRRGAKGNRGRKGARGLRGPAGATGPSGPRMKPAEVLALVDDQFFEIRKQLDLQLLRTGQLQVQLDRIQNKTTDVYSTLDMMHALVKQLVRG
jgi:hypothetical protein